jgi:hypothetical protein
MIREGVFHIVLHKITNGIFWSLLYMLKIMNNEKQISLNLPYPISTRSVEKFMGYVETSICILCKIWRVSSSGIWPRVVRRVSTPRTTRGHIPEDNTFHNHLCENLKSCICKICFVIAQYNFKLQMAYTISWKSLTSNFNKFCYIQFIVYMCKWVYDLT